MSIVWMEIVTPQTMCFPIFLQEPTPFMSEHKGTIVSQRLQQLFLDQRNLRQRSQIMFPFAQEDPLSYRLLVDKLILGLTEQLKFQTAHQPQFHHRRKLNILVS